MAQALAQADCSGPPGRHGSHGSHRFNRLTHRRDEVSTCPAASRARLKSRCVLLRVGRLGGSGGSAWLKQGDGMPRRSDQANSRGLHPFFEVCSVSLTSSLRSCFPKPPTLNPSSTIHQQK